MLRATSAVKLSVPHIRVTNPTVPTDTSVDRLPRPDPAQLFTWSHQREGLDANSSSALPSDVAGAEQHPSRSPDQGHGERSLWPNPSLASASTGRSLCPFTTPATVFPTLKTGIPARTRRVGQHPCVTHARCVNPWKKKG